MSIKELDFTNLGEFATNPSFSSISAIIIAPSGGGKSSALKTLTGKVLYLHGPDEKHGAAQASGGKAEIVAYNWGIHPATKEKISAADSYDLIFKLLTREVIEGNGITAVAVDSATSLEKLVRSLPQWSADCLSSKGVHNSFAESAVTQKYIDRVFERMFSLQEVVGVDLVVTCIADARSLLENGEYDDIKPRLSTFSVAEGTIQQFGEVLLVGPVTVNTAKGAVTGHCFQFNGQVKRESKDEHGNTKKFLNFTPRITCKTPEGAKYPKLIKADLDLVKEIKNK